MMNRLKLFVLVLIVALLAIIFIQNREPLGLKLLCPDVNQSCLYQTRQLPLALWMGLFILNGVIISFLGQVLNRYRYSGVREGRRVKLETNSNTERFTRNSTTEDYPDSTIQDRYSASSYEVPQEPKTVERSGSTYSYKYREASDRPVDSNSTNNTTKNNYNSPSTSIESDSSINLDKDDDDEDWV